MTFNHFVRRDSCPVCGSRHPRELYSAPYAEPPISSYLETFYGSQGGVEPEFLRDAAYILDEGPACGTIYKRLIPDDGLMAKLYEKWIDPDLARKQTLDSHDLAYYMRMARDLQRALAHLGKAPRTVQCLDFSMGWGEWCIMAMGFGCQVYGTEISPSRIAHARERGIHVLDMDALGHHTFDLINVEQVVEHLPDPIDTICYLAERLAPAGLIKLSVPNGHDIHRRLTTMNWRAPKYTDDSLNHVAPLEHINCFNHDALVTLAQYCGLMPADLTVEPPKRRRIFDVSIRDLLRQAYHWTSRVLLRKEFYTSEPESTDMFFKRIV